MNDLIAQSPIPLPEPRVPIHVRLATMEDLPFVDSLMKKHSKQLAFLPMKALEGKVKLGHVLVAEANRDEETERRSDEVEDGSAHYVSSSLGLSVSSPVGYLIGNDRYKSRDEIGVVYQLCVVPEYRRMLVAAHLLTARFETSAYGCRLYCCWCAQDLVESNRFYESMGFVPIAYRAGSEKRGRVHIFWQKRIRAGDTTTPWWFPSETRGGMMDAARIALPIPPGMRWEDELPRLVPTEPVQNVLNHEETTTAKAETKKKRVEKDVAGATCSSGARVEKKPMVAAMPGKLWFGAPKPVIEATTQAKVTKAKAERPKVARVKTIDPTLATKARELRDRWCERAGEVEIVSGGKYDACRAIETTPQTKRLAA